ncbi:hypothetical protein H310_12894 [Aphanomyces invadans]|uniref:Myb-like domain-containing protein n=1 Tax=Aphanomyces invadans TaxID=157072 RepID=A0A024TG14_9STRA|nr:hypothetical protein H310_12894 [Aphanomyces invadans]ETV93110.1 hypothetical protein H310_12894 [Aphanomyces invadans]|eukprot:XP_008878375.1 hypothetical protein H310_12894 [Aphanomyces invadans]
MSEVEGSKRKTAYRFTTQVDIDLLKEAMFVCPHDAPYGQASARWEEIAEHMRQLHGPDLTTAGCRKRLDDLIAAFKKDTVKSLRASGTEEEYNERDQLLQDLADMMENAVRAKKALKDEKIKKQDKRESDGHRVREAALVTLKRKAEANGLDEDPGPSKVKEAKGPSALKDAASAVVDIMSMIDASNEFKRAELEAKRESNALLQRKVELEEQRYLLDKAEREARFALEQQERQSQLQFMQSTIDLLSGLAKKLCES